MILADVPEANTVTFWASMGWVDVVLTIAFVLGVFFGLRKGFANTLAGLAEIVTADVVVVEYTTVFTGLLADRFQTPANIVSIIIFAVLALVSIIVLKLAFKLLSLIASLQFKQPLNQIGGALAGGLQFVLFFSLIAEFLMLLQVPFIQESFQQKSLSGSYLIQICEQVHYIFERWIPVALQAS